MRQSEDAVHILSSTSNRIRYYHGWNVIRSRRKRNADDNLPVLNDYQCTSVCSLFTLCRSVRSSHYVGPVTTSSRRSHVQLELYDKPTQEYQNGLRLGMLKGIVGLYL